MFQIWTPLVRFFELSTMRHFHCHKDTIFISPHLPIMNTPGFGNSFSASFDSASIRPKKTGFLSGNGEGVHQGRFLP